MKKALLTIVILGLLLLGGWAYTYTKRDTHKSVAPISQSVTTIVLTEEGFQPNTITIQKDTTITFKNETGRPYWPASNLHPTHQLYPEFDPLRPLEAEEEWSFTFERIGTHNFHDHIRAYFVGTIYVVE